jgi:hypothetical protein
MVNNYMGEIKWIRVSITPSYTSTPTEKISNVEIKVQLHGKPEIQYSQLIPDSDFQSRFEYFMGRITEIIKDKFV